MGNHTGNVQIWRTSGAYSAEAKTEKSPPPPVLLTFVCIL